jgi:serine/threonine protein kinase
MDQNWVFPGTNKSALAAYSAKVVDGWGLCSDLRQSVRQRPLSEWMIDLSDYTVGSRLGQGRFGTVYHATKIETGETFALKRMHWEWMKPESQNLFLREIEILSAFDHPAIVGFRGFCLFPAGDKNEPVILTELMTGGDLQELIDAARNGSAPPTWTETQKLIVLYGIASAMRVLHADRVFHRDLKPSNILLSDALEPKVMDFDLARHVAVGASLDQSGSRGTPLYWAPEVHLDCQYGFPADVYAFAMIAYVVLTGLSLFPDLNLFHLAMKVTSGERPPIPGSLSSHYRNLIETCWAQDAAVRLRFDAIVPLLESPQFLNSIDRAAFRSYRAKLLS